MLATYIMVTALTFFLWFENDFSGSYSYLANGVKMIPGLTLLGDPRLCIVSFTSEPHFHPYLIADEMAKKRWGLSRLQHPNCVHFYITPTHLKVILK